MRWLLLGLTLVAFIAGFAKALNRPPPVPFKPPLITTQDNASPTLRTRFVSTSAGPHRHAPSLVELSDGRLRAFWFSGSREGGSDVEIRSAVFDPRSGQWGAEQTVIDRPRTQRALLRYVKKLGNPVAERAADGTLHLYYVTVSLGGWAGSSITAMSSTDDGATWSAPRRLVTSPFINISTLVKGAPFHYADGSIGLPVYHEFIGKFGELLRLDGHGTVLDKQRLTHDRWALQPVVLVRDGENALVLMRHGEGGLNRVIGSSTADGGRHWTAPANTELANPNAAVAGVALPGGELLAVLNNIEANRDALSLVASNDGGATWRTLYTLEDQLAFSQRQPDRATYAAAVEAQALATDAGLVDATAFATSSVEHMCAAQRCNFEFSYPYLVLTAGGDAQLVYTWNRSFIKHVEFSRAWIERSLKETFKERANGQLH
ncbi:sialidase family protein [Propionivibrio sp.]|uniref:sialidase family protein n=1 Tax=Propionivibrio sp. TaxID=2212460 RepID=UPI003BEFF24D